MPGLVVAEGKMRESLRTGVSPVLSEAALLFALYPLLVRVVGLNLSVKRTS